MLGSRVDAALCDNFVVRTQRALLGLPGNSGVPPALHDMLVGVSKLADRPEWKVRTAFDVRTGKLDTKLVPTTLDVVLADGTKACRIFVDHTDTDQIPILIQRARKRHGMPLLSTEALALEGAKIAKHRIIVENPTLLIERSHDFTYVRHAMIKIAYELAFLWLGEAYLEDLLGTELRIALREPDRVSTDRLCADVGDATSIDLFISWPDEINNHLAYAHLDENSGIWIAIRVFDIFAAVVLVTRDAIRYLNHHNDKAKLRFLSIDPTSGKMRNVAFDEECRRIAFAEMDYQRTLNRSRIDPTACSKAVSL